MVDSCWKLDKDRKANCQEVVDPRQGRLTRSKLTCMCGMALRMRPG